MNALQAQAYADVLLCQRRHLNKQLRGCDLGLHLLQVEHDVNLSVLSEEDRALYAELEATRRSAQNIPQGITEG